MNSKYATNHEVNSLSWMELGTALYHIAQRTEVSLDYTERFKRDVLMYVSEVLCNAIPISSGSQESNDFVDNLVNTLCEKVNQHSDSDSQLSTGHDDRRPEYDGHGTCRVRLCHNYDELVYQCNTGDQIACDWSRIAHAIHDDALGT